MSAYLTTKHIQHYLKISLCNISFHGFDWFWTCSEPVLDLVQTYLQTSCCYESRNKSKLGKLSPIVEILYLIASLLYIGNKLVTGNNLHGFGPFWI